VQNRILVTLLLHLAKYFDSRLSKAGIVPSSTSTIALLIFGFSIAVGFELFDVLEGFVGHFVQDFNGHGTGLLRIMEGNLHLHIGYVKGGFQEIVGIL
jgi:hypothetical protein